MFNPNQQPQNVTNITTPYPNCPILDPSGKTSLAWEQFFRRIHLRTGNAIGVDSTTVKQTAEDALHKGTNASTIADASMAYLFKLDENLTTSNLNMQGIYASTLNNTAIILAILQELNGKMSGIQQELQELKQEIEALKGGNNGV